MATFDELTRALVNADAAGDTAAATALAGALKQAQMEAAAPPAAPAAAPGLTGHLQQFSSGMNEGLAGLLGLPGDLGNAIVHGGAGLINKVTGSDLQPGSPFYGSQRATGVMSDMGLIKPANEDQGDQAIRAFGRNAGPMMITGPASGIGLVKSGIMAAGSGIGGGIGNAVGGDVGEAIGGLAGGVATGAGVAGVAKVLAARNAGAEVPSIEALKSTASDLYDAAKANGVTATQPQTAQLAGTMRQIATDNGLISPTGRLSTAYPKVNEAVRMFDDYAQGTMTVDQMKAVRTVLSDAAGSAEPAERRIGVKMLKGFDDFTEPLAPELGAARAQYAKAMRAEQIEEARNLAEAAVQNKTTVGPDRAYRNEFGKLDRGIIKGQERGMTPALEEAIRNVARGTPAQKVATVVGKLAPASPASIGITGGLPFAVGSSFGGPVAGGLATAGTTGLGMGARLVANALARRAAEKASAVARNGGALNVDSNIIKQVTAALLAARSRDASEASPAYRPATAAAY